MVTINLLYPNSSETQIGSRERYLRWLSKEGSLEKKRSRSRKWYKDNKTSSDAYKRAWKQAHPGARYGLSNRDYEALVETQQGKCLLCLETPKKLCIDHDHETKQIRGLLCRECNLALGKFKDNAAVLLRAAEYIKKFQVVKCS